MKKVILTALALASMSLSKAQTQTPKDSIVITPKAEVKETSVNGNINWSKNYIEARGKSVIDTVLHKNKTVALLMAERGAIVTAQRNLLEIIQGVTISGKTTVKDCTTTSDTIRSSVNGFLKGAIQIGESVEKKGFVEVIMRVDLNGLATAVTKPSNATNANDKPLSDTTVILDVQGKYKPSLFPKLKTDDGKTIDMQNYHSAGSKTPVLANGNVEDFIKDPKTVVIKAVQDNLGNLVLDTKNNARAEKWKKAGNIALQIGKGLLGIVL